MAKKFSQPGTVIFVSAGLIFIFAAITMLNGHPENYLLLLPIGILILIILLIFYKLDVEVTDHTVDIRFGIGLIYRHIDISNISKATVVRNHWWMGWGIRFGLNYTLYNVSGLDAVELTLKGKKRKIRIGTNAPSELAYIINQKILS
jgi:hypothetical protein